MGKVIMSGIVPLLSKPYVGQYAYYKMGNSNLKTAGGNPANWWNRSPSKYNSTSFCIVTHAGYYNDMEAAGTSGQGVSFAFCI